MCRSEQKIYFAIPNPWVWGGGLGEMQKNIFAANYMKCIDYTKNSCANIHPMGVGVNGGGQFPKESFFLGIE